MRALFVAVLSVVLAASAALPAAAEMVSLSGQVTYRERVALPAGASLRLMLVDLTDSGAPPRVDVRAPIGSPGQVPLSFALNFDELALVPDHQHGIVAEILAGDELWFRNELPYGIDPRAPATPVVIVTTPATRPTDNTATASVTPPAGPSGLVGVTWRAIEIRETAVAPDVDSTMSIGQDRRAGGRGGCNNYFAQAQIAGTSVSFGAIAATRMACMSDIANAQEIAFFDALAAARSWRIGDDGTLALLDAEDRAVVRFAPMAR